MMMLVSRRSTPITCLLFGVLCVTTTFTLFLLATKRQKQQQPEKQQHHHRLSVSEPHDNHNLDNKHLKPYIDAKDFFRDFNDDDDPSEASVSELNHTNPAHCTFASCFNVSMCTSGILRVYIYPPTTKQHALTKSYREILEIIRASKYYTEHAEDACLFIPGFDTLSRDILSEHVEHEAAQILTKSADYVRWWNNGRNHLIFNFYAGTYPDYAEADIRMDVGYAMLAKASISLQHMRHGYDISVPLPRDDWPAWASADLPSYFVDDVENSSHSLQSNNTKLLLSFKGKRYVHGIGSESRDTLYLLNNKSDNVVLVVTCRHGRMWERLKDDRCDSDEVEFVHYDYQTLLNNSTFCLVPRGRRLGSYRFLEVLQAGCIPVVLSNEWILPFADELIDWSRAALVIDERVILELPEYLRGFISPTHYSWFNDVQQQPAARIREMLVHGRFLWNAYFSSSEKIVMTVLHIINDRVLRARMGVPTSSKIGKQQADNVQLRLPKSKWFQNQAGVGITHAAMLNAFENPVEPDGCNSLAQIKGLLPSCCGTTGITGDFPTKITLILRLSMQKYLQTSQFKQSIADNSNNTVDFYDAVLRNLKSSTVYEWLLSNSSMSTVEKIIIVLTVPRETETLSVDCRGGGDAQEKCKVHVEDFVSAVRTVASVWRRLHSVGVVIDSNNNAANAFSSSIIGSGRLLQKLSTTHAAVIMDFSLKKASASAKSRSVFVFETTLRQALDLHTRKFPGCMVIATTTSKLYGHYFDKKCDRLRIISGDALNLTKTFASFRTSLLDNDDMDHFSFCVINRQYLITEFVRRADVDNFGHCRSEVGEIVLASVMSELIEGMPPLVLTLQSNNEQQQPTATQVNTNSLCENAVVADEVVLGMESCYAELRQHFAFNLLQPLTIM